MRLIDADALIARVESDIKVIEDIEPQMAMGAIGVLNTIKKAPTASAVVRCKDCEWYDPPHIKYNDGTREDYPKEPFVTADIGSTVGGKCIAKNKIYCTAHDRENPDDYEEIVMFRSPDDYCSYGEKQVTSKLNNPDDSLLTEDSDACKEQKSKLDTDLISRQAAIEAVEKAVFKGVAKSAIESLPPVELKRLPQPHKCVVYRDGGECRYPIEDCSECPKHEGMRAVLAERQKGEWKCMADCGVTECDQCGWNVEEYVGDYNFCPSCGADMRGADDE